MISKKIVAIKYKKQLTNIKTQVIMFTITKTLQIVNKIISWNNEQENYE